MSMWEPFTEQARDAMVEAQKVAQQHGDSFIGHHHIFIAISQAPDLAQILASMGVDRLRMQTTGEETLGEGGFAATKEMTFTSEAKRMIELAFENARRLANNFIAPEHLALAYIDLGPKSMQIVSALEIDPGKFRDMLIASLEKKPKHRSAASPSARSEGSLEECFTWLGHRKVAELRPEALWDALSGAATERNLGAALAYAFVIARLNGWSAGDTARHIVQAAEERFDH